MVALDRRRGQALQGRSRLRFFFTAVDAGVSTVAGIVEDGILEHGFDVVNDEEWAAWLARHGAHEVTIGRTPAERSPVLRAVYDVAFGYPDGDIGAADCAAGTATSDLLRLAFSYRGSIMYKMQAGMGDVVFAPLYRCSGGAASASSSSTPSRRCTPGATAWTASRSCARPSSHTGRGRVRAADKVKALPCWPSEPRWEQLEPAAQGVLRGRSEIRSAARRTRSSADGTSTRSCWASPSGRCRTSAAS